MNPAFALIISLAIASFLVKRNIVNYLVSSEAIMLTLAMLFYPQISVASLLLVLSAMEALVGVAIIAYFSRYDRS